jgi:hypothetical protein
VNITFSGYISIFFLYILNIKLHVNCLYIYIYITKTTEGSVEVRIGPYNTIMQLRRKHCLDVCRIGYREYLELPINCGNKIENRRRECIMKIVKEFGLKCRIDINKKRKHMIIH